LLRLHHSKSAAADLVGYRVAVVTRFTVSAARLSIGPVESASREHDQALLARALSHAAELSTRLKRDQKELSGEGAELAQRVIDAAQRVAKLLAAKQPTELERHE
jgi:hypothetical protein